MYQQKQNISYSSQLLILIGLAGAGLLIGGVLSLVVMFSQLGAVKTTNVEELFKPENVNVLRWIQIISTTFLFFIPAIVFAKIVSKKPFQYLGYNKFLIIQQIVLVVIIMIACLPVVGALAELTEKIPLSPNCVKKFREAEEEYQKQVKILTIMKNGKDYILSLLIIAVLPAIFEETIFRGGLQNVLTRWIKIPFLAILITGIVFSAVHFSFYGFLSRLALGIVLGLIYYYSGNIWLNIIGHMFNNAAAVTFMYLQTKKTGEAPTTELESTMPIWAGLIGVVILGGLVYAFIRTSKVLKQKAEEAASQPAPEDDWMQD
ncbi:MAG TPA: CPBP family intramembrane glutamic endopeptidase [Chitinophagaceae bacterium]|nr:CPBP family intramembrane glutamic endopeptidase [Chitinophagaceae bacterium]